MLVRWALMPLLFKDFGCYQKAGTPTFLAKAQIAGKEGHESSYTQAAPGGA